MTQPQSTGATPPPQSTQAPSDQTTAQVIPLRPPSRWHDPLNLIQTDAPSETGRIVLWSVSLLTLVLF